MSFGTNMSFSRTLRSRRHAVAAFAALAVAAGTIVISFEAPVDAQTTPVTVQFAVTPPTGATLDSLPLGPQTAAVVLSNTSATPLTSTQVVVRMPPPPAYILSVTDGINPVGSIDNRSGVWYYTLPIIPANGQASLTVNWQMGCPGRWPLATRVGSVKAARFLTWVGPANAAWPC